MAREVWGSASDHSGRGFLERLSMHQSSATAEGGGSSRMKVATSLWTITK